MADVDPRGGQPADVDEHAWRPPTTTPSAEDARPDYLVDPFGDGEMADAGCPTGEGSEVPEEERL